MLIFLLDTNMSLPDILVLGGGGIKAIAMVGVLKVLEERKILENIKTYIGSSAGGLLIFLLNIGFNSVELYDILVNINFDNYRDIRLNGLLNNCGLDDGSGIMRLIKAIIKQKGIVNDITFKELNEKTSKKIILTGSNITTEESEFYDVDRTPDMKVLDAIRITISYPVIYEPVQHNNCKLVDGGFYEPFPFDIMEGNKLGVIFHCKNKRHEIKDFEGLLFSLFHGFINRYERKYVKGNEKNIIFLPIEDVHAMNFNITIEEKEKLYKIGVKVAEKYFSL